MRRKYLLILLILFLVTVPCAGKANPVEEIEGGSDPDRMGGTAERIGIEGNLPAGITYTVVRGDSLYLLARRYRTTVAEIKRANNLKSNIIYVGQTLYLPVERIAYTVRRGDTLYRLALKFNTSINRIKQLNGLDSDMIYIGQLLMIPGISGEPEEPDITVRGKLYVSNKTAGIKPRNINRLDTEMVSSLNTGETPVYREAEVIVKYKPVITGQTLSELETVSGLEPMSAINGEHGKIVRYRVPDSDSVEGIIETYEKNESVAWIEPNYLYYPAAIPGDSYYSNHQWNLVNMNLEAAWDKEKGSDSVTVAVLDTGVITDHPDLRRNLLPGADFVGGEKSYPVSSYVKTDDDPTDETPLVEGGSHGTHVAGIIGAVTDNYRGVAGVNWNVRILPVRVLQKKGGTSWDIAEGIYYAIDSGADIINLSLGSNNFSHLQQEAVKQAYESGVTVVAAAGNRGSSAVYYPAAYPETIAVGAVDKDNKLTAYSNFGPEIDVVAPGGGYGQSIYSTWGYYNDGKTVASYGGMIGTSMATPHVSGLAALLAARGIEKPDVIRERLTAAAEDLGEEGRDDRYGSGLIDAYGTVLGKKLDKPQVFAARKTGGNLRTASEMKMPDREGTFILEEVSSGEQSEDLYIVGWRDVNGDGAVNKGDYYGEVSVEPKNGDNNEVEVDLTINYISNSGIEIKIIEED